MDKLPLIQIEMPEEVFADNNSLTDAILHVSLKFSGVPAIKRVNYQQKLEELDEELIDSEVISYAGDFLPQEPSNGKVIINLPLFLNLEPTSVSAKKAYRSALRDKIENFDIDKCAQNMAKHDKDPVMERIKIEELFTEARTFEEIHDKLQKNYYVAPLVSSKDYLSDSPDLETVQTFLIESRKEYLAALKEIPELSGAGIKFEDEEKFVTIPKKHDSRQWTEKISETSIGNFSINLN